MSKQKSQGTKHESWLVNQFKDYGYKAKRLAEGGKNDEGDVEAQLVNGRWVFEAKARSTLSVQKTLGAARAKASAAAGEPVPVAVVWKRLVKVPGLLVRQPVSGERVVVVLSMDDFMSLIGKNTMEETENE